MSSERVSKGSCPPFGVDILSFFELIAIAADASCAVHCIPDIVYTTLSPVSSDLSVLSVFISMKLCHYSFRLETCILSILSVFWLSTSPFFL